MLQVIVEVAVPQIMKWFRRTEQKTFMQDGAPCHRAKMITSCLEENKIDVLEWPGNSPDLNPIENVWHVLKQEVRRRIVKLQEGSHRDTRKDAMLIEAITHCWHNSDRVRQTAVNAAGSMPRRIQKIIDAKGAWIGY